MSVVECSKEMIDFHKNKVVLSKDDQDTMRGRRDNGRTRLEKGLNQDSHPLPVLVATQGSYAMKTMVQDPKNDYDVDDGAYFRRLDLVDENGAELTPKAARQRICKALRRDDRVYPAEVRTNCVRQSYYDGYHIDVPVYRIVTNKDANGNDLESYELASGDSWVPSDARKVTKWFNGLVGELNSGAEDGSQLRRVVRLCKALARSRNSWKSKTTSGICITRLVRDEFVAKDGDDAALYETLKRIEKRLASSTEVLHPVSGRLAEHDDPEVKFYHQCTQTILEQLSVIEDDECSFEDALKAWDQAFDTSYFAEQLGVASKSAGIVVVNSGEARRDDGERRFG